MLVNAYEYCVCVRVTLLVRDFGVEFGAMKPPPRGLNITVILGGFVAAVCAALYPVVIHPYLHVDEYKKVQQQTRKDIDQESVQPGGMKIWSDPFGRK